MKYTWTEIKDIAMVIAIVGLMAFIGYQDLQPQKQKVILTVDQALAYCESQDLILEYESGECMTNAEWDAIHDTLEYDMEIDQELQQEIDEVQALLKEIN